VPINDTRISFPFSLQPRESYLLTVMLSVFLVYVLDKRFQICKRFIVHCDSFLSILDIRKLRVIVSSICDTSNYLSPKYQN